MKSAYYKEEYSLLNCGAKCTTHQSNLGGALPRQKNQEREAREWATHVVRARHLLVRMEERASTCGVS